MSHKIVGKHMLIFPKPFLFLMPINDKVNTNYNTNYYIGQARKEKKKNLMYEYNINTSNILITIMFTK